MSKENNESSHSGSSSNHKRNRVLAKSLIEQVADIFDSNKWISSARDATEHGISAPKGGCDSPTQRPPPYPDQWWNEYPQGDPNGPAFIFADLLSKSPRLIGWDDEKWQRQAFEIMESNRERDRLRPPDELPVGDTAIFPNDQGVVELDVNFGFIKRVSTTVAERIERFVKASDIDTSAETKDTIQDEEQLRDAELYQAALSSLQWQRDAYLVGPAYANQRKAQRNNPIEDDSKAPQEKEPPQAQIDWNDWTSILTEPRTYKTARPTNLPYDASALGNVQLARLGEWFIPSRVVQKALLPMVLGLPQGPLYQPAFNVLTNLIPMSQPTLDRVMKNTLVWFLQDEHWRKVIKYSMNGYIATTYRDSSSPSSPLEERR